MGFTSNILNPDPYVDKLAWTNDAPQRQALMHEQQTLQEEVFICHFSYFPMTEVMILR